VSGAYGPGLVRARGGAVPKGRPFAASRLTAGSSRRLRVGLAAGCVLLAWLLATPAQAEGHAGVDVVVLLDTSGSMRRNDPDGLRAPAVRLLVRLLGPEDRLSIIRFDERADTVVGLTAVAPGEIPALLAAAASAPATGRWTNLHAAVEAGLKALEAGGRPGTPGVLILLTDGKMDTADSGQDAALIDALKGDLAERLTAAGVRAYTLAFTDAADLGLLEAFATGTGGLARLARTGADLHRVFTEVFELVKRPQGVAIDQGRFPVDATVRRMTVVADRADASGRTILVDPQGGRLDGRRTVDGVSWAESPAFALVTVRNPIAGVWALQGGTQSGSVYVAADLRLAAGLRNETVAVGGTVPLTAWLEEPSGRVRDPQRLQAVTLTARVHSGSEGGKEAPDGPPVALRLDAERAEFAGAVTASKAGPLVVEVQASGPGFQRVQRLAFQARPAEAARADDPRPTPLGEGPAAPVALESAPVPAEPQVPAPAPEPAEPAAGGGAPSATASVNWLMAFATLALLNAGLGLLGGAVVLWRRRLRRPAAVAEGNA